MTEEQPAAQPTPPEPASDDRSLEALAAALREGAAPWAVEHAPPDATDEERARHETLHARLLDMKARWATLEDLDWGALLAVLRDQLAEEPQEQRALLVAWLARQLGQSKRRARSKRGPLHALFDPARFAALDEDAHDALWLLATSTPSARPTLHPIAAQAALLLWTHRAPEHDAVVGELLRARPIPDDPRWLRELGRALDRDPEHLPETPEQHTAPRGLLDLARLQLDGCFWNTAALIGALRLTHRYDRWRTGDPEPHLLHACDRASQMYPQREAEWLQLMADAAVGGRLDHAWLEHVVAAAIRLSMDEPERAARLRAFHQQKHYETTPERLLELHEADFSAMRSRKVRAMTRTRARTGLLDEARRLATSNPRRAQRLLELSLASHHLGRRKPTNEHMRRALDVLHPGQADPDELALLIALYVRNYEVDPRVVSFVQAWRRDVDLRRVADLIQPDALEIYLLLGDYERAFTHLTCKYEGVRLAHADKHAAARVRYFVERRVHPGQVTELVQHAFAPLEWLGQGAQHIGLVQRVVAEGLRRFEARARRVDLRAQVVEELRAYTPGLGSFADIAGLPMDAIDTTLRQRRSKRLLLGALAGGVSGGLSPLGWGAASLADVPIILGLAADICSRFCWYYGFDPREHPELPTQILAVALGGSRPSAVQPLLLRQNWREVVIGKSLFVGALHTASTAAVSGALSSAVKQAASRTIQQAAEAHLGARFAEQAVELARGAVSRNLQKRAAEQAALQTASTVAWLPWLGVAIGAGLNVALLYDICEAAEVVLTDRFLERKYPDWSRQFDVTLAEHHTEAPPEGDGAEPVTSDANTDADSETPPSP